MSARGRWLAVIVFAVGVWHNLALVVLWWMASRSSWSVFVDFNSRGEALIEGLLAHGSLLFLLVAFVAFLGYVRREDARRAPRRPRDRGSRLVSHSGEAGVDYAEWAD